MPKKMYGTNIKDRRFVRAGASKELARGAGILAVIERSLRWQESAREKRVIDEVKQAVSQRSKKEAKRRSRRENQAAEIRALFRSMHNARGGIRHSRALIARQRVRANKHLAGVQVKTLSAHARGRGHLWRLTEYQAAETRALRPCARANPAFGCAHCERTELKQADESS